MRTTRGGVFHGRGSARNHPSFVTDSSAARRLILASHGRLLWFDVDTRETEEIHQGRGVYYGVFPADDDGESVWVVSRPHNWRPKNTLEALLRIDLRSKELVQEVAIPSHFTHDAVRQGDKVYVADTGGGGVGSSFFRRCDPRDVSRLSPCESTSTPLRARRRSTSPRRSVGAAAQPRVVQTGPRGHGHRNARERVPGRGEQGARPRSLGGRVHHPQLGRGTAVQFTPPPESAPSDAKGILEVLWRDQQKTFMKGLSVIDGVAYFGIAEFGDRSQRDDEERRRRWRRLTSKRGRFCGGTR